MSSFAANGVELMSRNLADSVYDINIKILMANIKRLRKANKYAKAIANGGFGEEAQQAYFDKYPQAKTKR